MVDYGLSSAVVPVSGGASGIGLAICRRLRDEGALPIPLDIDGDNLEEAVRRLYPDVADPQAYGHRVDVSQPGEVEAAFAAIDRDHGAIAHAVASAGIVKSVNILDLTDEDWHRVIDINLNGMMYFCRAAGRRLAKSSGGSIVTIASIGGLQAKQDRSPYSASKAAVVNLTRALALDLGQYGVRANIVAPGLVETPIQTLNSSAFREAVTERIPLRRWGRADEIADVATFLLSRQASYISGAVLVADGGLTAGYS